MGNNDQRIDNIVIEFKKQVMAIPGVKNVKVREVNYIEITTITEDYEDGVREQIYGVEFDILNKYPELNADFRVAVEDETD